MKRPQQKRGSLHTSYSFTFPPDLERLILELAARSSSKIAVTLLQVSREVQAWIMPILCRVVPHINTSVSHRRYLNRNWYLEHGDDVRHLLLDLTGQEISPFISLCPNVQDLAIWGYPKDRDLVLSELEESKSCSDMPITHLSVNLRQLFLNLYTTTAAPKVPISSRSTQDFEFGPKLGRRAILRNVTHLQLVNLSGDWDTHFGLAYLPNLTHIAVSAGVSTGFLVGALRNCQELQAIVIISPWMVQEEDGQEVTCKFSSERAMEIEMEFSALGSGELGSEKIVPVQVAYTEDWIAGARGRQSMWTLADDVIKERRRKWQN
ncbi:hypothetical protein BDN72DRAFT_127066 [Pluteus cervinus]|uniref:Uncharacterized protein n=1 Tax=Pluteus cervinus TaxID=181527 RepID=A0ACD3AMA9_9AGAR|nr:hypothetical protein BDN72DRAFT_127066 [Pluteus cervinus]